MSTPLPKHIQEQVDEAEAIEQAMKTANQPPEEQPLEEPPVVGEGEPQAVDEVDEPQPELDWENKYRTLQSKYDIEVPRLHQQNQELSMQLQSISDEIAELKELNLPTEEPQYSGESLISEKDEEEFGSDLIDLQRRIAREQNANLVSELESLKAQNSQLINELNGMKQTSQKTSQDVFFDRLSAAVPNWNEIDQDPKWREWLAEVDPMTGMNRQAYLERAHNDLDVARVAAIFNAYQNLQAPKKPQSELQRQVTPTRSAASATAGTRQEKVWTQAEIAQALDPRNLRKMSADEITALNAEIDAAQRDGRISL